MSNDSMTEPARRPLTTRSRAWAVGMASLLVRAHVPPNLISVASVVFAAIAAAALYRHTFMPSLLLRGVLLVAAAFAIQLRLLCNMLDGMLAIEGNRRSHTGDLFNEVPDRIADVLILIGVGYGLPHLPWAAELGWICGALALLTAYVRALGQSLGTPAFFQGPMAKPHRMATLTGACVLTAALLPWESQSLLLYAALWVVALGSVVTVVRRLRLITKSLEAR